MAIWMGLSGVALAILAAGYVVGMLAERWRLERREFDAKIAGYEQRGGRHARGAAPAAARPEPASVPAGRPPWEIPPRPGAAALPRSGAIAVMVARAAGAPQGWTDAASIMPVTMPRPPQFATVTLAAPQRGRYPDQDTGRLGKLTDTGEIRAITDKADASIAAMRADNAAWLDKWGAGATA